MILVYLCMAKETNKKPPKEASNIFQGVIAAAVKGNPKPKPKKATPKK